MFVDRYSRTYPFWGHSETLIAQRESSTVKEFAQVFFSQVFLVSELCGKTEYRYDENPVYPEQCINPPGEFLVSPPACGTRWHDDGEGENVICCLE